jgi:hypothetical protein
MKTKCLVSSLNKEDLQKAINRYYYSENYIITEDNKVYNTKLNKFFESDYIITVKNNRWQLRIKIA